MSVITKDNLDLFCYTNGHLFKGPVRAVVLSFYGLGGKKMWINEDIPNAAADAGAGLLDVIPYTDPWNWMNPTAVALTDDIIDVIFERYQLPEGTPIISTGGSMGGLCAIVYCRYAKRTPTSCVVNCPVCDLPFHYTERPDLPRTLYAAFYKPGTDLTENLKSASPCHLTESLPDIPYTVFHCTADTCVNIRAHSEKFVSAMREAGKTVEFIPVPDRDHCNLTPEAEALFAERVGRGAGLS